MNATKMGAVWLLLGLVIIPVSARANAQDEGVVVDRTAHQELREAVDKIRAHYRPAAPYIFDSWTTLRRPRLGILVRGASADGGDGSSTGAEVLAVTPGSPAAEAGLQTGDVITAVNSISLVQGVDSVSDDGGPATRLIELTGELSDGEEVTLEVRRGETLREFKLIAREFDSGPMIAGRVLGSEKLKDLRGWSRPSPGAGVWFLPSGWMDMELVALNPGLGEYFGADEGVLVVRASDEDGALGLESGDVILEIGGRKVSSPEHAMRILRSYAPEEELVIRIVRHGGSQTLTGSVPEESSPFTYRWFNDRSDD